MSKKNLSELFNIFVENKKLILETDYSNEKLTVKTKITGYCTNENCKNIFSKILPFLLKSENTLCLDCNNMIRKKKIKEHNYQTLKNIINKCNLVLLKDYSNELLTMKSKIEGKCTKEKCIMSFNKNFEYLIKTHNTLCNECAKEERKEKVKQTCLEKYGVEHISQDKSIRESIKETCIKKYGGISALCNDEIRKKSKQTCLEKYGFEHATQNKEIYKKIEITNLERYGNTLSLKNEKIKEKSKNTIKKKYGVEYITQSKEIKEKIIKTNIEKYGTICPLQNKEIRKKTDKTNLEKYGTTCTAQSEIVKKIILESNIEKYGVNNYAKTEECKDKVKKTCLEKFGKEHYFQSEDKQIKSVKTCLEKYGVEYPMQSSEIADKSSKNAYLLKEYTFPSGAKINIQGYENFGLDILINKEKINEENIITSRKLVPEIWYNDDNNKKHRHFVDIFINSQNRCIEIKSTWTFKKNKDKVLLKQESTKKLGYLYEIWVFDDNGNMIESYK